MKIISKKTNNYNYIIDNNSIINNYGLKLLNKDDKFDFIKWEEIIRYTYCDKEDEGYIIFTDKNNQKNIKLDYNRKDIDLILKIVAERSNIFNNFNLCNKFKESKKQKILIPLISFIVFFLISLLMKNLIEIIWFNLIIFTFFTIIYFLYDRKEVSSVDIFDDYIEIDKGFKVIKFNQSEIQNIKFTFKFDDDGYWWLPQLQIKSYNYKTINILPWGIDPVILYYCICKKLNKNWA